MKDLTGNKKLIEYLNNLEIEIKDEYIFGSQLIHRIKKDLISGKLKLYDNISNTKDLICCGNENKMNNY